MSTEDDPRTTALLALAGERIPPPLLHWLLRSFEGIESTDFGELEPIGVAAPVPR